MYHDMKNTQPDEKEYSAMTIAGLTKEDLVVIVVALVVTTSLFISCLIWKIHKRSKVKWIISGIILIFVEH